MGIEISIQDIKVVIININGDILISVKHHEPLRKKRKITLEDIIELSNKALKAINLTWNNISVLGVGTAGIIDEINGKILLLPNAPNLENLKIVQALREKTGVKNIHITDYVRSMAVSESRYGKGKEFDNFILFNICADLGAGIIINKKLISGSMGIVGEIGHIYVGESRELCVCGNYGCLESVASGSALVNRAKDAISKGVFTSMSDLKLKNDSIQIDDIIEAAKQGDKLAVNLIEETTKYLSIGVSTLMNLLDPQAIILAGALINKAGDLLIKPLVTETEAKTLPWIRKHINLFPSELGEYISARGAARLAIDRSFDVIF
ncbi:N-acetylglucosamine repressor [subsurface metagenome]